MKQLNTSVNNDIIHLCLCFASVWFLSCRSLFNMQKAALKTEH